MTGPKNQEEYNSKACELDRIAFERGLIEGDEGSNDGDAAHTAASFVEELEITDETIVAGSDARILIIDDDDQFRGMLREMLATAGYESISEAADGQQGLERLAESHPDLIITDMVMPVKLGIDTIMEIRKDFPNARIIAVSGGSSFGPEIELDMAAKLGVRTFKKPFERQEILKAISELLALG